MSTMTPRERTSATMEPRESTAAIVYEYKYNEPDVRYDQPLITYEYETYRGNIISKERATASMKGKN